LVANEAGAFVRKFSHLRNGVNVHDMKSRFSSIAKRCERSFHRAMIEELLLEQACLAVTGSPADSKREGRKPVDCSPSIFRMLRVFVGLFTTLRHLSFRRLRLMFRPNLRLPSGSLRVTGTFMSDFNPWSTDPFWGLLRILSGSPRLIGAFMSGLHPWSRDPL
jgi:hypothetical protein